VALSQIVPGDLVLCAVRGQVFHAEVSGAVAGGLRVDPLERSVRHRLVKAADVVGHWSRQPRPNSVPDRAQATFDHLLDR
jgi:hypothetical protein